MKKLLTSLMTVSIIASSASTVVACGSKANKEIWLITDAGKVDDKSFNQSGFDGGNYFNQTVLGNEEQEISKIEPSDLTELESSYKNAKADGAKVLILPGFHHAVEGKNKAPEIMGDDGTTILLDNDASAKNQISIMFRGDFSGFYAGISSLVQLSSKEDKTIKMATYGGNHNPGAVTNFMVGFLATIEVFNEIIKNDGEKYSAAKDALGLKEVKTKADRVTMQKNAPTKDDDTNWFTNSFAAGDGKTISEALLASGQEADVIMPVAGPQTKDTLDAINDKRQSARVIGVDTNQADQYTDEKYNGKFLTSAEKPLYEATVISLGHSKQFIEMEGVQDKTLNFAKEKTSTFTKESDGKFATYDLEKNKADKWEGQTLWMGGRASSGGKNQVKAETYKKITDVIKAEFVENASIALFASFKEMGEKPSAKEVLSEKTINAYAKVILDKLAKW